MVRVSERAAQGRWQRARAGAAKRGGRAFARRRCGRAVLQNVDAAGARLRVVALLRLLLQLRGRAARQAAGSTRSPATLAAAALPCRLRGAVRRAGRRGGQAQRRGCARAAASWQLRRAAAAAQRGHAMRRRRGRTSASGASSISSSYPLREGRRERATPRGARQRRAAARARRTGRRLLQCRLCPADAGPGGAAPRRRSGQARAATHPSPPSSSAIALLRACGTENARAAVVPPASPRGFLHEPRRGHSSCPSALECGAAARGVPHGGARSVARRCVRKCGAGAGACAQQRAATLRLREM
jgi:hypothetical protein